MRLRRPPAGPPATTRRRRCPAPRPSPTTGTSRWSWRSLGHRAGQGAQDEDGRGGARVLVSDRPRTEVAGPALAGLHAHGLLQPPRGGAGRRPRGFGQVATGAAARPVRPARGTQRVAPGLAPLGPLAA